jgi:tetratricopeptide (TPR) repeat protein
LASYKTSYKYLVILGSLLILTDCSVEKNTGTSRFYHSLTSKYNIYFNGNESFKSGVAKVNKGYRDDFSEILKVFEYSEPSTSMLCTSDMERAIQKASKVISLKSITTKPESKGNALPDQKQEEFDNRKEYNDWVDDCYLLMGKARVYKHEFTQAESTLSYTISAASDIKVKIESTIWLTRIYNETGNYNESLRMLNELDLSIVFTKELKGMYYCTLADLFIKQKRYSEAIDPLGKSLEFLSGKRNKYRLTYLLAQLYEVTGDGAKATKLYRDVVNMNPPYEVEFNARINIAGVFELNTGNPNEIKRELGKMLRDVKNKEFQDQIYFALGNLAKKEGNEKEALEYYRKSAMASSQNSNQKGKSYLALAGFYYNKPDYINAGKYYDSAVFFIDQKYPDYKIIKTRSQNLNRLVTQLSVIQRQDSLQKVAKMSESDRNTLIASIIESVTKSETEKKPGSEYADRYNLGQYYENERRFQGNIEQEGKWYFYNQAAMTFGRTEFKRRWGDRKLEDNWRRINKTRVSTGQAIGNQEENGQIKSDTLSAILNNKKPEFYLKNLPSNDSLILISNSKIATAYHEAGKIYYDNISDKPKAVESFEKLLNRFPGNELEPESLYYIYKIYKEENNSKSETYRQILLKDHPENDFAKMLSDPEYYNKKLEALKLVDKLYLEAYNAYSAENFKEAISQCDNALGKYSNNVLAPKFLLLRAYCIARTTDERTFKEELDKIIRQWPETAESNKAKELIAYLNQKIPELKIEDDKKIATEIYIDDKTSPHIFVLIIKDPAFNINLATFDVISYNIDNYTNKNYRTEGMLVDDKYIMITVGGFTNTETALEYYKNFRTEKIVRNTTGSGMGTFIISKNNLESLNKDKNPERYQLFFNEKYNTGEIRK